MNTSIQRCTYTFASYLFFGLTILQGLLLATDFAIAQCNNLNTGCYNTTTTPPTGCQSTTGCTDIIGWGTITCNVTPDCDDGNLADDFQETQNTSFYNCASVSCGTYPACSDGCVNCASVFLYRTLLANCSAATRCNVNTFYAQSCGTTSGTSCNNPCPPQ